MVRSGILHDYDLMANEEQSSQNQTCVICGISPMIFQWSDYSGEAMCAQCGCPYQLKWGGRAKEQEGKYPYLNLQNEFILIAQEYWNKTHQFVCYGIMLGNNPGMPELSKWVEEKHPEWINDKEESHGSNDDRRSLENTQE